MRQIHFAGYTFELTITFQVIPIPVDGDVGAVSPQDVEEFGVWRRRKFDDDFIPHFLVQVCLCEDMERIRVTLDRLNIL